MRHLPIKDVNGLPIGTVLIEPKRLPDGAANFDLVLSPITSVSKTKEEQEKYPPKITGFQLHSRTTLRTEPRSTEWPYDYIMEEDGHDS